jgi:hypothetical protein
MGNVLQVVIGSVFVYYAKLSERVKGTLNYSQIENPQKEGLLGDDNNGNMLDHDIIKINDNTTDIKNENLPNSGHLKNENAKNIGKNEYKLLKNNEEFEHRKNEILKLQKEIEDEHKIEISTNEGEIERNWPNHNNTQKLLSPHHQLKLVENENIDDLKLQILNEKLDEDDY